MFSDIVKHMFKKQNTKEQPKSVDQKIMDLTVKVKCDVKDCSPNLKNLHNRTPKVKRLSNIFDTSAKEFHNKCNWWLDSMTSPAKKKETIESSAPSLLMDILEPKGDFKIEYLITKLQKHEHDYVNEMQFAMDNYVQFVDDSIHWKQKVYRWQKQQLFGNLRNIYKFHKYNFQPRLVGCGDDIKKLAQLFISSIDYGSFYCYVNHAIVEMSAGRWRRLYRKIFDQFYEKCGREVRFHPMEHLLGYKKLLHDISTELHKDFDSNFKLIVAMYAAENSLQKLINQYVHGNLVDSIVEVKEVSINVHMELKAMTEGKIEETIDLFLLPREDCFYGYRQPINIMKLGKFLQLEKVSIRLSDFEGSHESHFFVFERCLIYTVAIRDGFFFTGIFWLKTTQVGSVFDRTYCTDFITLRDQYRTVVLETPTLFDLIKDLKAKSDKDLHDIPQIFLAEKQLKKLFKLMDRASRIFHHKSSSSPNVVATNV